MTNISKAISCLQPNELLKIVPQGYSMYPFFVGKRDEVFVGKPCFPLKRGDICVYLRADNTYVVHRIYKIVKTSDSYEYFFVGDHQTQIEGPLKQSQIHGVVNQIKRKGKLINCKTNIGYRFLSSLWLILRPVRPVFFKLKRLLK